MLHIYAATQHLQRSRSTVELAEELGLSRFMIGRMVRRALDDGLVEVRATVTDPIDVDLSNELARKYGLTSAFAVQAPVHQLELVRTAIADIAARLVTEIVEEDDVIGMGSGRTILEMCRRINEIPRCDIVQLTGVATSDSNESLRSVMTFGSIARGRMFPLHAPLVTTAAGATRILTTQPAVRQALKRVEQVNKAVMTLGGWPHGSLLAKQMRDMGEEDILKDTRIVAEIGTTLLDIDGNEVDVLAGRMIGIRTDQLRGIPVKVIVGGGPGKEQAVVSVLRAGLADHLVTDVETAHLALRMG